MKQVDFINILSSQLPETFKTEQLLLVLLESSSPKLTQYEVRKCMHNHLYRLEHLNLLERLCPKRTRNASFKRLFSYDSANTSLHGARAGKIDPSSDTSALHLFEQHVKKLKEDTNILHKKRNAFSQLIESYEIHESFITHKLCELDSVLLDKKIELEAVNELMGIVCKTNSANRLASE